MALAKRFRLRWRYQKSRVTSGFIISSGCGGHWWPTTAKTLRSSSALRAFSDAGSGYLERNATAFDCDVRAARQTTPLRPFARAGSVPDGTTRRTPRLNFQNRCVGEVDRRLDDVAERKSGRLEHGDRGSHIAAARFRHRSRPRPSWPLDGSRPILRDK